MKKVLYCVVGCLLLICSTGYGQYSIKDTTSWNINAYERLTYTDLGQIMPYRLLKPTNYNPAVKYPLVIMLHGKGEGIGQPCTNLHGLNSCNIVWGAKMHYDSLAKYPSFVIFPQCKGGDWENATTQELLLGLIKLLFKTYPIDLDRVYIHGISGGARGIWQLSYKYPNLFAAISPHSASGDPSMAERLLYNPIWNVQGEIDFIVRPKISVLIFDEFRHLGKKPYFTRNELWRDQEWSTTKKIGYAPVYSVIPSESHVSWPHLYNSPTWLNWLYSQNKNKIQVVGRTVLSPGETTRIGISPGFEAYEWTNGATSNEIVVRKAGTYRVRYKRKQYFFSGPSVWSAWSEPITITFDANLKPEADAGRDVVVFLPDENAAMLRGFAAGVGMTYNWTKLSGPKAVTGPTNLLDLSLNSLVVGTYTYRFTATDIYGNTVFDDVNLYVIDKNAPKKITGLTLVNADNGNDLIKVNNGAVINIAPMPAKNFNLRVNTDPILPLGSYVFMTFDGKVKEDSLYPFSVFGDANCLYNKGTLSLGTHHLAIQLNYPGQSSVYANYTFTVTNSLLKIAAQEEPEFLTEEVNLYPNPVVNQLQIQFKEAHSKLEVYIYNQMGGMVKSYEFENSSDGVQLDIQELPSGMYTIMIDSENLKNKSYRIIKK